MRSILTWKIAGEDLVGTLHAPPETSADGHAAFHGLGVLLLNAGPAPRAGNSDLSVHVADALAARGIHAFRFDFAGLGDSSGPTPHDKEEFFDEVLAGRHDAATLELVRRIEREYRLPRVVVGGLCAASVPALVTADRDSNEVAGTLLLEPALHSSIPRVVFREELHAVDLRPRPTRWQRALSLNEWLRFLTGENRVARAARPLRKHLLNALEASAGHTLPPDANVTLIGHWQNSLTRGVPSLAIVAEGQRVDGDLPRILGSFPEAARERVTLVRVPRTNHILTSGTARAAVVAAVLDWLEASFGAPVALTHARAEAV